MMLVIKMVLTNGGHSVLDSQIERNSRSKIESNLEGTGAPNS